MTTRGVLQWDVLRLFEDVLAGLRAAAREGPVDSVGVDSWAIDFGLLDGSGRLLRNPVHYRDRRRGGRPGRRARRSCRDGSCTSAPASSSCPSTPSTSSRPWPPRPTRCSRSPRPSSSSPTSCTSGWEGGPSPSGRTPPRRSASTSTREPGPPTCSDRLGLPSRLLPEVVPPGTPLGPLDAGIAETGLAGATVIAPATHDTASAVAAVPFRDPRSAYVSAGTWSLVGLELDAPLSTTGRSPPT